MELFKERVDNISRMVVEKPNIKIGQLLRELTVNLMPSLRAHSSRYVFSGSSSVSLVLGSDTTFCYPKSKENQDAISVKQANILK